MALRFSSETEQELLARAVDSLPRVTKFPVAFGGLTTDGLLPVTATAGTRTRSLAGLVVQPERGLGGRSLVEKRARLAIDYRTARGITHDYDRAVLGEALVTFSTKSQQFAYTGQCRYGAGNAFPSSKNV